MAATRAEIKLLFIPVIHKAFVHSVIHRGAGEKGFLKRTRGQARRQNGRAVIAAWPCGT